MVESFKAFTRGLKGKGFPGALNEVAKTFQHSLCSLEPKDLTPEETALKYFVGKLTYSEKQEFARYIKILKKNMELKV